MDACIFCNGSYIDTELTRKTIFSSSVFVASDGGIEHMFKLGIKPDCLIGDMDSVEQKQIEIPKNIKTIIFPRAKDTTDTELAIDWAFENGCKKINLLAAFGDRIDHILGHFSLAKSFPNQVFIIEQNTILFALKQGQEYDILTDRKLCVSIVSLTDTIPIIKTIGLKYTLNDEKLISSTHGISNYNISSIAKIIVKQGSIFVTISENVKNLI